MIVTLPNKKKLCSIFAFLIVLAMFFPHYGGEARAAGAPTPGFAIGDVPFRFLGGFLPGWHWGWWSEAADDDLIQSARATGMTVIHIMLPLFEGPLGVYDETKLQKLDHFLASAYNANVYVMPSFIQAYSETLIPGNTEYPYYHERGIEGIIKDPTLRQAFKNRIAHLVNRTNTANGRLYRQDPTILAWIVCDEPISAPFNYPAGPPQVSLQELTDWFRETASYIKSLDPNHLVTVWSQPAIQSFFGGGTEYLQALAIPEFDFMYAEDADLAILPGLPFGYKDYDGCSHQPPDYMLQQFLPGKPVAFHPAFTSGCWDTAIICDADFTAQSTNLGLAIPEYFDVGANAVLIQNWGTDLYSSPPDWALCRTYTDSYPKIVNVLKANSEAVNPYAYPLPPLGFVRVIYGLTIAKAGSGSGTVTSSPAGIACGTDCSEAFIQGTTVTLTGSADPNSLFTGWSGGGCSGTGVCEILVDAEITVTATFDAVPAPFELSPNQGTLGTEITASGAGFGTKKGKVLIGNVAAKIGKDGWQPDSITCTLTKVPLPPETPLDVQIVSKEIGTIFREKAFTVKLPVPQIDAGHNDHGAEGTLITVKGNFFGTKKGKVFLEYLGKNKGCKVTDWNMNSLTFIVPKKVGPGTYPLFMTNKVGTALITAFTIDPAPP